MKYYQFNKDGSVYVEKIELKPETLEALQNNLKEIPLGYELAEIDSDMNLIMNMLLTKLTVKQTLLEDRDKQLGIWREWTIYFWVNYDDTTNITLNLLKTDF